MCQGILASSGYIWPTEGYTPHFNEITRFLAGDGMRKIAPLTRKIAKVRCDAPE
ncbi:hypothetical protein [Umezakia ovalisporum]|uniref:Uncharacterized protein n=2 Tax=Umezakia ovalisporum TaxID=75695 RepID=A0AA43KGR1_9CYAN|nr:hypothetical protein [Umezakia ovalisporum]MDH6058014.1 hypothetical protein [Umezakia ovalisporum FSS-43]MDH6065173.1 hypothetical protein [Umezakia ovalisporum FSS-62]MDH6066934.1 hypothetical protein [Umezakia ovalisporum APH033B]MDH6072037.1 hypothetical protein [Umezakia ovalisporum CobakiLakeA]MDH6074172.1 hypothetical protein [Umezakia ovalisporum CS-1034]